MPVKRANGNGVSKAAFPSSTPTETDPLVTVDETLYETYAYPGEKVPSGKRRIFRAGQRVRQSVIDALFPTATVTSVAPMTGTHLGGTPFTVTGKNLSGTTGITINGVAATSVVVASDSSISAVTPAGAAGSRAIVVQDDSGNIAAGNWTYT